MKMGCTPIPHLLTLVAMSQLVSLSGVTARSHVSSFRALCQGTGGSSREACGRVEGSGSLTLQLGRKLYAASLQCLQPVWHAQKRRRMELRRVVRRACDPRNESRRCQQRCAGSCASLHRRFVPAEGVPTVSPYPQTAALQTGSCYKPARLRRRDVQSGGIQRQEASRSTCFRSATCVYPPQRTSARYEGGCNRVARAG